MIFRVSECESFRQWRADDDAELSDLLARLRGETPPSDAMLAGTAFHRALELATVGETAELEANGYRFVVDCDAHLALPDIRELRASKAYGPITVTGCVDVIHGLRIEDHKTTGRFDPDRYLDGYQWRLYLDIFGAKVFRWNVFEIREKAPRIYSVLAVHQLEQHAYPRMHDDCARLASDLHQFALEHMPERREAA